MKRFFKYYTKDTRNIAKKVIPLIGATITIGVFLNRLGRSYPVLSIVIFFFLLLLTLVVIPLIERSIKHFEKKQIANKIPLAVARKEAENEISKIEDLISKVTNPSDLYKLRFIAYRMGVELLKYKAMEDGVYKQFCLDKKMYFMYTFRSALDILRKGDVYRAVTTIDIWLYDEDDCEIMKQFKGIPEEYRKSFLKSNIQAARRQVKIERYFIIDEIAMQDINSEYYMNLKKIVQRLVDVLDEDSKECKFFFCPTRNYEAETKEDIAFALVKNEDYDSYFYLKSDISNSELPYVEANFVENNSDNDYRKLYTKLKFYRNKSHSEKLTLKQMAKKLEITKLYPGVNFTFTNN